MDRILSLNRLWWDHLVGSGGLTHGSGMTEEQRAIWTMSVPITTEYNNAMQ